MTSWWHAAHRFSLPQRPGLVSSSIDPPLLLSYEPIASFLFETSMTIDGASTTSRSFPWLFPPNQLRRKSGGSRPVLRRLTMQRDSEIRFESSTDPSPSPDSPHFRVPVGDPKALWTALSRTPGVGVSITDAEGRLLFVNDTSQVLFSKATAIAYQGKRISDFHPTEFVKERLALIGRVLKESRPLAIRHVYHGRRIESTLWPICDPAPPYNRVIVVSIAGTPSLSSDVPAEIIEQAQTQYIDLGPLNVLTRRELEVLVLLGNGLSVPKAASVLFRSPKTIQRHKAAISQKLQVHGQAELVELVASVGLQLSDAHLKRLPR